MLESKIKSIIQQGEGLQAEFKECKFSLSKNIFETVCAFLNRSGGKLLLGVDDKGKILGIQPESIQNIKNNFIVLMNNPKKICPPFYLSIDELVINRKAILYIYIPESSQVHRCNNRIFDRNGDGDFDITDNQHLVSALYLKKQTSYSESKIYPYAEMSDLRQDIIALARKMASFQREDHAWGTMNDLELLKSACLYENDYETGKSGITLAGILLFGKESTILSVLPHFKTDAILRRDNADRYDDRDDIRTNLIESYDRLLHFGEKHLNDPFYLEGDQRISLRNLILREVVSNLLIHREFTNPFPAKFIIDHENFYTENSNRPHHSGNIDPITFSPCPKNPAIARVFREIGRADELGSGVRNLFKFCKEYCGNDPRLVDGDIFKFVLPLIPSFTEQVTGQVTEQVTEQDRRTANIIDFCQTSRSTSEILAFLGLAHREHFRSEILNPLLEQGLLQPTIPDKPRSSKQKYYSNPRVA